MNVSKRTSNARRTGTAKRQKSVSTSSPVNGEQRRSGENAATLLDYFNYPERYAGRKGSRDRNDVVEDIPVDDTGWQLFDVGNLTPVTSHHPPTSSAPRNDARDDAADRTMQYNSDRDGSIPTAVENNDFTSPPPPPVPTNINELFAQLKGQTTTEHSQVEFKRCPVCDQPLESMDLTQSELHVNQCLDSTKGADRTASSDIKEYADVCPSPHDNSESSTSSTPPQTMPEPNTEPTIEAEPVTAAKWSQVFSQFRSRVAGIWSSTSDAAPGVQSGYGQEGMPHSKDKLQRQWFGPPRKEIEQNRRLRDMGKLSRFDARRPCPFYKKLPGTYFTVDAFRYGKVPECTAYFLTHFHSDHYGGLTSSWKHGPIYASVVTANLVIQQLGVDPAYIVKLPMDVECPVPYDPENPNAPIPSNTPTVTCINANHCPGSVLFLFKVPQPPRNGKPRPRLRYLHTGDFRANPQQLLHPAVKQPENPPIDILYLDTTYLNPRYAFPAQEEIVEAVCGVVQQRVFGNVEGEQALQPTGLAKWMQTSSGQQDSEPAQSIQEPALGDDLQPQVTLEEACKDTVDENVDEEIESMANFDFDLGDFEEQLEGDIADDDSSTSSSAPVQSSAEAPSSTDLQSPEPKAVVDAFAVLKETQKEHYVQEVQLYDPFADRRVSTMSETALKQMGKGRTLVVIGTYLIGKEKVFLKCAQTLKSKIYVTSAKKRVLLCQENPEIDALLTSNPREAAVHVVPLGAIRPETLSAYIHGLRPFFASVLAFRPTGWTYKPTAAQLLKMQNSTLSTIVSQQPHPFTYRDMVPSYTSPQGDIRIYGVPYSEHSSFRELACFCGSLNVIRIIPTVNIGSEKSRQNMERWFRKWAEERQRDKLQLLAYRSPRYW